MTEYESIEELKDENEHCYDQCEGCCSEVEENVCTCRDAIILSVLEQYRAIGTVEECREARERQRGKKPVYRSIFTDGTRLLGCPVCFSRIDGGAFYCNGCGQKLDWSE